MAVSGFKPARPGHATGTIGTSEFMLSNWGVVDFARSSSFSVSQLSAWPDHKSTAIEAGGVSNPERIIK